MQKSGPDYKKFTGNGETILKELNLKVWPDPARTTRAQLDYRYKIVTEWLSGYGMREPVLDIGPPNEFGKILSDNFNYRYHYTVGDLDYSDWHPTIDKSNTVLCFEVLEHLINPGLFLTRLKMFIDDDTDIFVSVPRRGLIEWMGSNSKFKSIHHFHEFDEDTIQFLFKECGYKVLEHRQFLRKVTLRELFGGWKEIIRTLSGRQIKILVRTQFYRLRRK